MKNLIKLLIVILSISVSISLSYGSDTKSLIGNNLMVKVNNLNGRFIMYYRENDKSVWQPLMFDDANYTSFMKVYIDDIAIDFGEGGRGNDSSVWIDGNKIFYYWKNSVIRVDLNYELISVDNSIKVNTLKQKISFTNISKKKFKLNVVYCIDTYLGEKGGTHFILPGDMVLNYEDEMRGGGMVSYIKSRDKSSGLELALSLREKESMDKYRVVFTNWKRYEGIGRGFVVKPEREFDLKPYSINDSALFIEYKDVDLRPDENAHETLYLYGGRNVEVKEIAADEKRSLPDSASPGKEPDKSKSNFANMSLDEILRLLDSINSKLENGETLTKEDVDLTEKLLKEIESR